MCGFLVRGSADGSAGGVSSINIFAGSRCRSSQRVRYADTITCKRGTRHTLKKATLGSPVRVLYGERSVLTQNDRGAPSDRALPL